MKWIVENAANKKKHRVRDKSIFSNFILVIIYIEEASKLEGVTVAIIKKSAPIHIHIEKYIENEWITMVNWCNMSFIFVSPLSSVF